MTFAAGVVVKLTAAWKLFALLSSVMLPPVARKVAGPAEKIEVPTSCVISPPADTVRELRLVATISAKTMAPFSRIKTLVPLAATAPPN